MKINKLIGLAFITIAFSLTTTNSFAAEKGEIRAQKALTILPRIVAAIATCSLSVFTTSYKLISLKKSPVVLFTKSLSLISIN